MSKLLEINSCIECFHLHPVDKGGVADSDYHLYCDAASNREIKVEDRGVPSWCPLPDKKEVKGE